MYGAIIGDIVGSIYERANTKTTDFELFTPESTFTDDTVLSVAVAEKNIEKQRFFTYRCKELCFVVQAIL